MTSGIFRTALVLGLLASAGPFAIDMYLPALPAIGADLGAGVSQTQSTLTLFFVAFGAAQLVYGPLADRFGRKPPLHAGLAIFAAGSLGCALAPDIGWLAAARFAQGLGGAALMVIPRAIVRDMLTGPQATRLMAAIMLVISVSPMLPPLAGSGIIALSGWRSIFVVLAVLGALGLALSVAAQPETLPPVRRVAVDMRSLLRGARTLLGDPVFMGRCSWGRPSSAASAWPVSSCSWPAPRSSTPGSTG